MQKIPNSTLHSLSLFLCLRIVRSTHLLPIIVVAAPVWLAYSNNKIMNKCTHISEQPWPHTAIASAFSLRCAAEDCRCISIKNCVEHQKIAEPSRSRKNISFICTHICDGSIFQPPFFVSLASHLPALVLRIHTLRLGGKQKTAFFFLPSTEWCARHMRMLNCD